MRRWHVEREVSSTCRWKIQIGAEINSSLRWKQFLWHLSRPKLRCLEWTPNGEKEGIRLYIIQHEDGLITSRGDGIVDAPLAEVPCLSFPFIYLGSSSGNTSMQLNRSRTTIQHAPSSRLSRSSTRKWPSDVKYAAGPAANLIILANHAGLLRLG